MTKFYKVIPILILLLSSLIFLNCENSKNDSLLEYFIEVPHRVTFLGLESGSGQVVLKATYRITGSDAEMMENLLLETFHINELQFACCGWESIGWATPTEELNEHYNDVIFNSVSIEYYSEETLINDRAHWKEIEYFYIIIELVDV